MGNPSVDKCSGDPSPSRAGPSIWRVPCSSVNTAKAACRYRSGSEGDSKTSSVAVSSGASNTAVTVRAWGRAGGRGGNVSVTPSASTPARAAGRLHSAVTLVCPNDGSDAIVVRPTTDSGPSRLICACAADSRSTAIVMRRVARNGCDNDHVRALSAGAPNWTTGASSTSCDGT